MNFGTHIATPMPNNPNICYRVTFENGYAASIICGEYTYGGSQGLWELAVIHDRYICYLSPITSDVLGYLTDQEVADVCDKIAQLPRNDTCEHKHE